MTNNEFDLEAWERIKLELMEKFPQLTNADVIWRHETKNDFYRNIAADLGITKNELEEIIAQF